MDRQAWRDFFITVFFLGIAFLIALVSTVAAENQATRMAAILAAVSLIMALIGALYIVPRLAKRVKLDFVRFAVRTSVTSEGVVFSVFLMIIAFAAWNTGNNILFLVLSALLAFLIAANFMARAVLADVSVQLRFPDHIFAEEPASLSITVTNHKRLLPSYSLVVETLSDEPQKESRKKRGRLFKRKTESRAPMRGADAQPRGPGLRRLAHFLVLPARSSARQRIEHRFAKRGRYPITAFKISTKFPTGFFKKWRKIDAAGEILVYPRPKPLDDFYHALPMLAGQVSSQLRGYGDDLYAIRRYHPSDHIRHIDWKATAKTTETMVREHVREDERRLTIVLDTSLPARSNNEENERALKDRFENAVVLAASLAKHFVLERAEVELLTPGQKHDVRSGAGFEHLYEILRALAVIEPESSEQSESPREPAPEKRRPNEKVVLDEWSLLGKVPLLGDDRRFKVVITSAAKGSIPANVWRSAHVVFTEDLV
jgi:uncharacterized protein (DUF58 family)